MALEIVTIAYLQLDVGGVAFNVHPYCSKIGLEMDAEDLNVTTMGDGFADHMAGIKSGNLIFGGFNDYADNLLDEYLWTIWLAGVNVTFDARKGSGSASTSNPKFTGSVAPIKPAPLMGTVGQVTPFDLSWPTSGTVTRGVS